MKWIFGVSLVAVIVGAAATMTIPAQTITPDEATLKLFPPETQGIAHIDVAGLRSSPLVQDLLADANSPLHNRDFKKLEEATGFKPERDLDRVTAGRVGAKDVLVIAQARYDRFRMEQFLKDNNATDDVYLGRTLYKLGHNDGDHGSPGDHGGNDGRISFIDNMVIAGSESLVKQAIDRLAAPAPSLVQNSAIMDQVRKIERGNQVWAVGEFSMKDLPKPFRGPAQAEELLNAWRGGTYQMRVDSDVHVRAVGNFTNEESAKTLSDLLRGIIGMAKLHVAQEPDMLHLLDGLQVRNSGSSMTINFDAPGDLLKKLKGYRPKRASAQ